MGAENGFHLAGVVAGLARVRLVHDDGVPAASDLLRPAGRCIRRLSSSEEAAHHERELLQRRDDDHRSVGECLGELTGVLVDDFDDTLDSVELCHGRLAVDGQWIGGR